MISHEIEKLKITHSPRDLAIDVISPLLNEVGLRLYSGYLSVSQEQALLSLLKFHIGNILFKNYSQKNKRPYLIGLATPETYHSELGILLYGLLCCHYGVKVFYMGPSMPAEGILEISKSIEANIILIGAGNAISPSKESFLNGFLEKVLKGMTKEQSLWLGGAARFNLAKFQKNKTFNFVPDLNYLDGYLKELI